MVLVSNSSKTSFDIYIAYLSNPGIHAIHAIAILTKYLANLSANTFRVRTLVDPENFLPHLLAAIVNLSV